MNARWIAFLLAAACGFQADASSAAPTVLQDCADCPELIVVAAGSFTMGSSTDAYEHDERSGETPPLGVRIGRPFALGRFELQVHQFQRFLAASGHRPRHACATDAHAPPAAPARCLTQADALAYLDWLGALAGRRYRLPSEAEWEHAARAGTTGARSWSGRDSHEGVSISRACDFANVYDVSARGLRLPVPHARCADGYVGLAPAGSFQANPWGFHDLVGNVRERLADCFTRSYKGRPADERAWRWEGCTHQSVRGGSWRSRPFAARSAARDVVALAAEAAELDDVGLRVARDLDEAERLRYAP